MFEGVYTALVTPFRGGKIDDDALRNLVREQIDGGVTGIVPAGTTGESATMSHDEQLSLIKKIIDFAGKEVQVIAGTGSNSTAEAIKMTQSAEKLGATSALLVTPYYNKPPQEGIFQHFKAISSAVSLPIMLYNIPGRVVVSIEIETIARLIDECPNILSIKEAGGDVQRVIDIKALMKHKKHKFDILSGDDPNTLEFMQHGAVGVVSVVSNIIPTELSQMVIHELSGRGGEADKIATRYQKLIHAMLKLETNPIPIKTALALQGKMSAEFRLPLVNLSEEKLTQLKAILLETGCLKNS